MENPNPNPEIPPEHPHAPAPAHRFSTYRIFSGMKIRKKLIVLHTSFSLGLGAILLIAIIPAMSKVIFSAEVDQSERVMEAVLAQTYGVTGDTRGQIDQARIIAGDKATLNIPDQTLNQARLEPGKFHPVASDEFAAGVICWLPIRDEYLLVRARSVRARNAIRMVYLLLVATLVVGYALVAGALELFVLPQHVYRPITAMLHADLAVSEGDIINELIPQSEIPADELGSIMSSRNDAILALRTNERELAHALDRLEHTAADLHKKNHLLETARKNLEGADRLASLGMMSAGIAHELNTPLAVVKGLVEKLNRDGNLSQPEIALLSRVVRRLETLSDGLLDFARVRPPMNTLSDVHELIKEAATLVSIDRKAAMEHAGVQMHDQTTPGLRICCNPDRLVQVFVNLIRNAIDALVESGTRSPQVEVRMQQDEREGQQWVAIKVLDNGPGIDAELIDRLFEPFVSTRLDAHGTGLGLAVANGIVREHGGLLIATNRGSGAPTRGAEFEVLLPMRSGPDCE